VVLCLQRVKVVAQAVAQVVTPQPLVVPR